MYDFPEDKQPNFDMDAFLKDKYKNYSNDDMRKLTKEDPINPHIQLEIERRKREDKQAGR